MADVVVVGAGVIGLTSALVLQDRGCSVAIWARELPAATTSAVAAAVWYPYLAEPRDRVLRWSTTTCRRLRQLAAHPDTGVFLQPMVEWFTTPTPDLWWAAAAGGVSPLPASQLPARYRSGVQVEVPVCDTSRYLPWLLQSFLARGGTVLERELAQLDDAHRTAPVVVNCSGLGARRLCRDDSVRPVRGQVLVVDKVDLAFGLIDDSGAQPVYVVPRRDDIVLGGTAEPDADGTAPDAAASDRIRAECCHRLPQLAAASVRAVKVGLRPWRPTVRLDAEHSGPRRRIVHNYGHGGAGFTLAWGCAEEVASLVGAVGD